MSSDTPTPNPAEGIDSNAQNPAVSRADAIVGVAAEDSELMAPEEHRFFVVGIGASAGGLRALETFFAHMPQDSGAAFVVIQHLSPDYKSLMKELLGRCTRMTIHRVEDGMAIAPNSIYLIPPGQNLTILNRKLVLTQQDRRNHGQPYFPIDLFFESLAQDCANRTIAIVLSGTGSDGSKGVKALHGVGGITLVQDPMTAEFDGMPQSAISTGRVDRSLPVPELAQLVYALAHNPAELKAFRQANLFVDVQETQLQQVLQLLVIEEGIDFSQYKAATLNRRIQRRCLLAGFQSLTHYLHLLETSEEERRKLRNDLLISVTRFFRNPKAWEFLKQDILPPLVKTMSAEAPLRIWITACATGEEAYSMAILVDEVARNLQKPPFAKIFATDLDGDALEKAAQGRYPNTIANDVSESRLQRYFTHKDNAYEIVRHIREMIIFAPHNLVKDTGFSRMHLVSCRNVLIYMETPLQQQVLRSLHFSMQPHGLLFLGESENLGSLDEEFIPRERRYKIYEKRRDVRLLKEVPEPNKSMLSALIRALPPNLPTAKPNAGADTRLQEAFRQLATMQQCCCMVLDEGGSLIHVFGATPDILPPPNGPISHEASKVVAPLLQAPLSAALSHARKTRELVHYSAITLNDESDNGKVSLQVCFYQGNRLIEDFFVVLIQPEQVASPISYELSSNDLEHVKAQRIVELETELQRTRESQQAIIEELETVNEEQQASNEEMIASNEELQSTNEELQSVNEELYTVNVEYQSKIQELTELNNDIDNLLRHSDIGVVFLDQELRVRKFTPAATEIISLVPSDIARPINHLTHNLEINDLHRQLRWVLATDQPLEQEVKVSNVEQYLLMRINPYRLEDQTVDGIVLTFVDITVIRQAQKAIEENNALLRAVINSTPDQIYVQDASGRYQLVNDAALQALKLPASQVIGEQSSDINCYPEVVARRFIEEDRKVLETNENSTFEESLQTLTGEEVHHLTTKAPFHDADGASLGIVTFVRDVTMLKQIQANLQQTNQDLHEEIAQRQLALQALQESETLFRCTFEQAAVGIAQIAPDGTLLRINQRFADIVGYTIDGLLNRTFQEITHPDDSTADLNYVNQVLDGDISNYTMVKRCICKDRTIVWVELTMALVRAENGEPRYFISVIQDITVQKNLEMERDSILWELAHEKELAQVTLHSIGDAVITTDAEARVQYCNPIAEQLTGWPMAEAQGKLIHEVATLLDEETREPTFHPVATVLAEPQGNLTVEHLILVSRDGREFTVSKSASPMRDRQGRLLGVVTVFRDVTEARTLSRQLSWQASHDPLTGLMNRRQFEQELIYALAGARMDDRVEHILCYLDLDQFKVVNDTSGHLAGDELLRQVALLLKSRVRGSDSLARLGGDEFGVLLQSCPLSRAEIIANNLREAIQAFRFVWENRTFSVGVSIGLVTINNSMLNLPTVLSAADAACYAAKEQGRNRVYIYQPDDADVSRQRQEREWSVRIRSALEHNQFCFYQQSIEPAQQPSGEEAVHYEVLLRMIDDNGTLIPPNAFIPAAERYNLMPQVDRWVVHQFLLHIAEQEEPDSVSAKYMVNLSGASLTDNSFLTFLQTEFNTYQNLAQRLCFEITETAAIANLTVAVGFIAELQKLGCQFALDDFGSGMSSFGYLKTLPVDYVKIDGKFVRDITKDPTARAIVESINNIGHIMGLQTIAESVESEAERHCLQDLGVDFVQGFGVARPKPLESRFNN